MPERVGTSEVGAPRRRLRVVPERSGVVQVVTVFAAFTVGPYLGLRMAVALTPESDVVQTFSTFAFVLVFVGGMIVWMGLGVVTVAVRFFARLVRRKRTAVEGLDSTTRLVPPGYGSFPALGGLLGALTGLVAGLLTGLTVAQAGAVWTVAGLAYGFALWAAARHGYLPFPEPE